MKESPLVSVIVLNYNAGELLVNCIDSLKKSTYTDLEIIVVDNISSDGSQTKCKERFPDIKLIQNNENLGYCGGNNVGIKEANGEFVVILNPDTEVDPNWIDELIDAYQKFGDGLYQPKHISLRDKSVIMSTGNMMNVFGFGFARQKGEPDKNQFNKIERINYASGTCLFTTKKVIDRIGLLDEFLFLYHDDLDFGWRAAQIGINSYYVPKSIIFHMESYSLKWSAEKFYWLERNRKYCLKTHYSKTTYKGMNFSLWMVDLLVWMYYISRGFLGSKIRAELDLRRSKKIIQKRYSKLEKMKNIPDIELIKTFPDGIFVPMNVSQRSMNRIFNFILTRLSKKVKEKIK